MEKKREKRMREKKKWETRTITEGSPVSILLLCCCWFGTARNTQIGLDSLQQLFPRRIVMWQEVSLRSNVRLRSVIYKPRIALEPFCDEMDARDYPRIYVPHEAISASPRLSSLRGLWFSLVTIFSQGVRGYSLPFGSSSAGKTSLPKMDQAAAAVTIPAKPVWMS